jgi:hypothetical protein
MTRRYLLLPLALTACRRPGERTAPALPETVAGGWRKTAGRGVPPAEAPEPLAPGAVRRASAATYEGPGRAEVTLYELNSSASALDAVQRWRPQPNTVFFYKDNLFVVVKWQGADRKTVGDFVRALEKQLAG